MLIYISSLQARLRLILRPVKISQMNCVSMDVNRSSHMKLALLMFLVVMVPGVEESTGQVSKTRTACPEDKSAKRPYTVLMSSRALSEHGLRIFVLVERKSITREGLLKVVSQIRRQHCDENRLFVEIFDRKKYAGYWAVQEWQRGKNVFPGYRGHYVRLKEEGLEELTFSLNPGGPIDEVVVDPAVSNSEAKPK